jgi:predicted DNA-binding protein with PD1-like motif
MAGPAACVKDRRSIIDSALCAPPIIVPMQAESLEVLEKADLAPAQARAIVRAIEIEIAGASNTLATKRDVLEQKQDLRREIVELGAVLRVEMAELAASLRGEMAELAASLRGEMAELRAETRTEIATLRTDMAALRGELKAEIHAAVGNSTRQMYMALLGQMAVLLGFAYFFATHVR